MVMSSIISFLEYEGNNSRIEAKLLLIFPILLLLLPPSLLSLFIDLAALRMLNHGKIKRMQKATKKQVKIMLRVLTRR